METFNFTPEMFRSINLIPQVKPYKKCKDFSDFYYYHLAHGCTPEAAEKFTEFDLECEF